ncbi:MAG: IS1634 family transposase [Planctomycetaceae bacterium]|nr:IS1634 family transposase [Planctomycetaceae bacterium]
MYPRTVKVRSSSGTLNEYVRVVEAYREDGKVKQRVVADLGRKDLLVDILPKLKRLLGGDVGQEDTTLTDPEIVDASTWGPLLVVRSLFDQLGLWSILDRHLGRANGVPFADRAFVLVANRLIAPASEHGLAGWLETDLVCDRKGRRFVPHWHQRRRVRVHPRQLDAWYRTLDQLHAAKDRIEVALYQRLRDLFSLKPDLVLYDITSTYFEGTGPHDFAKHGYSRDGKSQNVQVIVGVVMVAGWPIAHHVWEGNRVDHSTVQEVINDLRKRFEFGRVVLVGDRGMVTDENLESLTNDRQGFLVGIKRRRNPQLDAWLDAVDDTKWIGCPGGINAQERRANPLRTRAQEVPSGSSDLRVFVIDSDERRGYEQAKRAQAMERARQKLEKLQERIASGDLKRPEKIGAAVERIMQRYHGYRYFDWKLNAGSLEFSESETHLEREKKIEGKYVIATSEKRLSVLDVVALYKELTDVESGFRQLKDVMAMRPIYHQVESRVKAHIFVAALALLVQRLLGRRLQEAGVDLSAERAMQALSTVRLVSFHLEGQGERRGITGGCPDARLVLKALKLVDQRPPTPPEGEETVM